jgi:hypothetical protein
MRPNLDKTLTRTMPAFYSKAIAERLKGGLAVILDAGLAW